MNFRPRSLQGQLALRLAAVFIVVSAAGVGLLLWEGSEAADSFGLEMLRYRTDELARHVRRAPDGRPTVVLPPELLRLYSDKRGNNLYAVKTASGEVMANNKEFSDVVVHWQADPAPRNFRLEEFGANQDDYYGLAVTYGSASGPLTVAVAHSSDADVVAAGMLEFFASRIAWTIPLFALITLLIGAWSIRRGLRPLAAISRRAATIDPRSPDVRLPVEGLPSELVPLVHAVNSALDRLEEGFAVQRSFTANAAHELRTPLTMLTAGLDELRDEAPVAKLRGDVARMNRLVGQLLQVARLDILPVNRKARVDLAKLAEDIVAYLAPWAITQGRSIGLSGPGKPVWISANADEVGDALRNLIENALHYAPAGTEVAVLVADSGHILVNDRGPGVPAPDRPHIFGRFWRGAQSSGGGAGLGLAIVSEILRRHGGRVVVDDAPGGGASFRLEFPKI